MIYICKTIKQCKMPVCLLIILWIALMLKLNYNFLLINDIISLHKAIVYVYFK